MLPSDAASRQPPLCFTNPSPPSGWTGDFHSQAIEHAGHATKPLRAKPTCMPCQRLHSFMIASLISCHLVKFSNFWFIWSKIEIWPGALATATFTVSAFFIRPRSAGTKLIFVFPVALLHGSEFQRSTHLRRQFSGQTFSIKFVLSTIIHRFCWQVYLPKLGCHACFSPHATTHLHTMFQKWYPGMAANDQDNPDLAMAA